VSCASALSSFPKTDGIRRAPPAMTRSAVSGAAARSMPFHLFIVDWFPYGVWDFKYVPWLILPLKSDRRQKYWN
jgi:hypothetical protein